MTNLSAENGEDGETSEDGAAEQDADAADRRTRNAAEQAETAARRPADSSTDESQPETAEDGNNVLTILKRTKEAPRPAKP